MKAIYQKIDVNITLYRPRLEWLTTKTTPYLFILINAMNVICKPFSFKVNSFSLVSQQIHVFASMTSKEINLALVCYHEPTKIDHVCRFLGLPKKSADSIHLKQDLFLYLTNLRRNLNLFSSACSLKPKYICMLLFNVY